MLMRANKLETAVQGSLDLSGPTMSVHVLVEIVQSTVGIHVHEQSCPQSTTPRRKEREFLKKGRRNSLLQ